jgi:hypothetical protein
MRRFFILCAGLAACAALAACQTTKAVPPMAAPVACPPSLTAPLEAQPPVPPAAYFELADSPEARAGGDVFLAYVEQLARWGRTAQARAHTAKTYCEALK